MEQEEKGENNRLKTYDLDEKKESPKKKRKVEFVIGIMFLALVSPIIGFGQGRKSSPVQRKLCGYFKYTFGYDTLSRFYYPLEGVFIDSASSKTYALIGYGNMQAYYKICKKLDTLINTNYEKYGSQYLVTHDSAFDKLFLEGNFYEQANNQNIYCVFKGNVTALIIEKACKKYLSIPQLNYHKKKQYESCPNYLGQRQIFIKNMDLLLPLSEIEIKKHLLKRSIIHKIRYTTCI